MQDGAAWLADKLKQVAGRSVVFARGSQTVTVTGTATIQEYEVMDASGVMVNVTSRDYVLSSEDIVLAGQTVKPRPGDTITETILGLEQRYEVMDIVTKPAVELMDVDGVMLLVHTKQIKLHA